MNETDIINIGKWLCFPTDERGRDLFYRLCEQNRVIKVVTGGEIVNVGKKEPCIWVHFIEGKDSYLEQENEPSTDDGEPTGNTKQGVKK